MKKMINTAFIYMIVGLVGGVFYREFTKFNGFVGKTSLGVVHTHFIVMGMVMFLLLACLVKAMPGLIENKRFKQFYTVYNIALPFMGTMFIVRGVVQVLAIELAKGPNAAISGIAGISHILMAVALFMLFSALKKEAK